MSGAARRYEPPVIGVLRNCSKCGEDFRTYGDFEKRICPECKKPKAQLSRPPREVLLGKPLTTREKQIVLGVSKAKLNKEIAYELHLAEGTVKVFMSTIFGKCGVTNRTALAVWAIRNQE